MTTVEQRRAWVLTKVIAGALEVGEAADLLDCRCDRSGERVRALARGRYDGANDSYIAELLAEPTGSASTGSASGGSCVRRGSPVLAAGGRLGTPAGATGCPRPGCSDGSRHDWLEDRGPRLTLIAAIDDATGTITGATFREQEDAAGYLTMLRDTIG